MRGTAQKEANGGSLSKQLHQTICGHEVPIYAIEGNQLDMTKTCEKTLRKAGMATSKTCENPSFRI